MIRTPRKRLAWETVAVFVFVALAAVYSGGISLPTAMEFFAAIFFLNLFDLWLPHGDSIDVDTGVVFVSVIELGALGAVMVLLISRVLAHVLRHGVGEYPQLVDRLSRRAGAMLLLSLAYNAMGGFSPNSLMGLSQYAQAAILCLMFVLVDLVFSQVQSYAAESQPLFRLIVSNLSFQAPLLASQVSAALLILVLLPDTGLWGLMIVAVLLLVMRQAFSSLLEIRHTYRATLEALADAIEAAYPSRKGHANRVADVARMIGMEIGLRGKELEHLSYVALLHDVDLLGTEADSAEQGVHDEATHAAEALQDVRFLAPIMPALRLLSAGEMERGVDSGTALMVYISSLASDIDDVGTVSADAASSETLRFGECLDSGMTLRVQSATSRVAARIQGASA